MNSFLKSFRKLAADTKRIRLTRLTVDRNSAVRLLQDKLGRVRLRSGDEATADCPFCGHREKLSVNVAKRCYHCWHCNASGTLSQLLGVDISVARSPEPPKPKSPFDQTLFPPSVSSDGLIPLGQLPDDNPAIVYLRSRGFDPDELDRDFALRYCAVGRKFARVPFDASNTIVIPFYANGNLTGWQTRLLYDPKSVSEEVLAAMGYTDRKESGELKRPPKYMTSPGLNKRETLYNIDWARQSDTVVVTEGVFDCIRVGRKGVATLGKLVSDYQKRALATLWKTIVLLLDPDAADDQNRLADELTALRGPRIVRVALKGYKDAGDCPRDELWRQIDAALQS